MKLRFALLLFVCFTGASRLSSQVVAFEASGQWEYYSGPDFDYHLVPFTATFSYDTTAAPTSQTSDQAVYPALSFTLTVELAEGTWTHSASTPKVTVFNGQFGDSINIASESNLSGAPTFLGDPVDFFGFELRGAWPTLSDTSLPATLALDDYWYRKAKVYAGGFTLSYLSKDAATLGTPSAVPEPATWTLIVSAAALGIVALRRYRSRAS